MSDLEYDSIIDSIDENYSAFDMHSNALMRLRNYLSHSKNQFESHCCDDPKRHLWNGILKNLSNTRSKDVINDLVIKTGLDSRQVRDFYRNQRKRYILPISKLLDEEIHDLMKIMLDSNPPCNQAVGEIYEIEIND